MLCLGIDTSGRKAGVALLENGTVLVARSASGKLSAVLLPMIAEALESQDRKPSDLELIGVTQGPGTYTGLRVGVVTAKTLGRTTGAAVLGIPTLEAMASYAPNQAQRVLIALHAYKKRFLYAWFNRTDGQWTLQDSPHLVTSAEVPETKDDESLITNAPDLLDRRAPEGTPFYEDCSVAVARLALKRKLSGAEDQTYSLAPEYLKPPSVTVKPGRSFAAKT